MNGRRQFLIDIIDRYIDSLVKTVRPVCLLLKMSDLLRTVMK